MRINERVGTILANSNQLLEHRIIDEYFRYHFAGEKEFRHVYLSNKRERICKICTEIIMKFGVRVHKHMNGESDSDGLSGRNKSTSTNTLQIALWFVCQHRTRGQIIFVFAREYFELHELRFL